ncbi:hypothetical protein [Thermogemmatispora tikiterensis]|uniref:Response regulatory domain-containing protein n=2 Tax=Thermogemmatispora TaxID=768669 RepID=A0A328VNJ4_9CHLR|nr:hypothetical protein [Thermogemmatispora tikiterensis]RAQ96714.1 hypothetical protein A4R35_14310 [Thermogemmatispora tikiterensis]
MQNLAPQVVSIADACLGGLHGRSALLIGPEELRRPFVQLLKQAGMQSIYEEESANQLDRLLPQVQLLISIPAAAPAAPLISAAAIAQGCGNRQVPLIILDLARSPSVEEMVGLLPFVCLYTPADLQRILHNSCAKAS